MISLDQKVNAHPAVHFVVLEDEAVLLQAETEEYYTLDQTGTRMWQLLLEHGQPQKVIPILLREFLVEEEQMQRDLQGFINDCANEGLLIIE